jgi:hypothetical protein
MGIEEGKAGSEDSEEMKGVDQTRRALIRAGWVLPAVLALQLQVPSTGFAASGGFVPGIQPPDPHVDASATAHADASVSVHADARIP